MHNGYHQGHCPAPHQWQSQPTLSPAAFLGLELHSHMKARNQEDPEFSLVLGPTGYVCMYLDWLTLSRHKCMVPQAMLILFWHKCHF